AEIEAGELEPSAFEADYLAEDMISEPDTTPTTEDDDIIMPAWLMGTQSEVPPSETEEDEPEFDEPDDSVDTPHWLLDTESDKEPDNQDSIKIPKRPDDTPVAPAWLLDTDEEPDTLQAESQESVTIKDQPIKTPKQATEAPAAPAWLLDADADEVEADQEDDTPDVPAWLLDSDSDDASDIPPSETEDDELTFDESDDTLDMPHWLLDTEVEPDTPLFEAEEDTTAATDLQIEEELIEEELVEEAEEPIEDEDEPEEELVMPEWLFKGSLEELDTPEWLQDMALEEQESGATVSSWMAQLQETTEQSDSETDADGENYTTASQRMGLAVPTQEPPPPPPPQAEKIEPAPSEVAEEQAALTGAPTQSAANLSGWLEALRTGDQTDIDDDDDRDSQPLETTGMLASLGSFMPAEKLFTPTADGPLDDVQRAAQKFHEIATQPPQPATLPVPLSRSEKVAGRALRAVLQLLFVALIALPLLPGTGKFINGQRVPWTEPTDNFSTVLDEQRRQLISEQIGIIDVQQPDSVALVSFDYSPATQGEMQPLAEAIMGRLVGQGMRIIAVSLEPEGAAIAQTTIEQTLSDRDQTDLYGQSVVNLGYLPGQVAAVRALADGRSFTSLVDFNNGEPFAATTQTPWNGIETLEQVDLVVTLADNPTTARWWIEQLELDTQNPDRLLLAATSAVADPFLQPYRQSEQLDGLISGINGAAAIEAVRNNFGPAREMLDSQSIAHLIIIILIAVGTMVGWMPQDAPTASTKEKATSESSSRSEPLQDHPVDDADDEDEYEIEDEDEPEIQE
ncbi:MAG: hypothetical protein KDJ52_20330, partial [Anaerolineae bacterium]|nr:hypothetical protein [Anaerolineae bacterium]